jgi:hypothetical protein
VYSNISDPSQSIALKNEQHCRVLDFNVSVTGEPYWAEQGVSPPAGRKAAQPHRASNAFSFAGMGLKRPQICCHKPEIPSDLLQ